MDVLLCNRSEGRVHTPDDDVKHQYDEAHDTATNTPVLAVVALNAHGWSCHGGAHQHELEEVVEDEVVHVDV